MKRLFFDRMVPIVEKLKDIALKLRPDLPINSQPRTVNDGLTLIEKAVDGLGSGSSSESGSSGGSGQSGSGSGNCAVIICKESADIPESLSSKAGSTDFETIYTTVISSFMRNSVLSTKQNVLTIEEFAWLMSMTTEQVNALFAGQVAYMQLYSTDEVSEEKPVNCALLSRQWVTGFGEAYGGDLFVTLYQVSALPGREATAQEIQTVSFYTDGEYVATKLIDSAPPA